MPRVGLISDTHGHLDPQVLGHFAGVDHIVHAGDIGWPGVLLELEALAPVTAVSGNTDVHPTWRETELVRLHDRVLLIHHIVEPHRLKPDLQRRILRDRPDVVVFGHTHATFCEVIDGVMYVNPGSAGRARFGQSRTIALLHWETGATELDVEFIELGR